MTRSSAAPKTRAAASGAAGTDSGTGEDPTRLTRPPSPTHCSPTTPERQAPQDDRPRRPAPAPTPDAHPAHAGGRACPRSRSRQPARPLRPDETGPPTCRDRRRNDPVPVRRAPGVGGRSRCPGNTDPAGKRHFNHATSATSGRECSPSPAPVRRGSYLRPSTRGWPCAAAANARPGRHRPQHPHPRPAGPVIQSPWPCRRWTAPPAVPPARNTSCCPVSAHHPSRGPAARSTRPGRHRPQHPHPRPAGPSDPVPSSASCRRWTAPPAVPPAQNTSCCPVSAHHPSQGRRGVAGWIKAHAEHADQGSRCPQDLVLKHQPSPGT
jgi:hypothetical protein